MLVIGVTGGIGSGKTAATDHFQSLGITVVDADLASRVIVEPGREALLKIEEHFGKGVIADDGTLDRRALRDIVFNNPDERKWLEQLTHPLIGQEILRQIQTSESPYTILASPLLLESGQSRLTQRILLIDVPEALQIERTKSRDNTTEDGVRAIMKAQMSRDERRDKADDIIVNDQDLAHLHSQVEQLHQRYLNMANQGNDAS